jgi:hypothetical protein
MLCGCLLCVLQGCNTEAVRMLLGGEDLSDANMLAHLGIIEQRSNELLQVRVGRKQCLHFVRSLQPACVQQHRSDKCSGGSRHWQRCS